MDARNLGCLDQSFLLTQACCPESFFSYAKKTNILYCVSFKTWLTKRRVLSCFDMKENKTKKIQCCVFTSSSEAVDNNLII